MLDIYLHDGCNWSYDTVGLEVAVLVRPNDRDMPQVHMWWAGCGRASQMIVVSPKRSHITIHTSLIKH